MTGDCHVRICESLGVRFPWATRLYSFDFCQKTSHIHWQSKVKIYPKDIDYVGINIPCHNVEYKMKNYQLKCALAIVTICR